MLFKREFFVRGSPVSRQQAGEHKKSYKRWDDDGEDDDDLDGRLFFKYKY